MPFYYLTAKFSAAGIAALRKTSAVKLEQQLSSSLDIQRGERVNLYFSGSNFDLVAIIEAQSILPANLLVSLIESDMFIPGARLGRILTAEEAGAVIGSVSHPP